MTDSTEAAPSPEATDIRSILRPHSEEEWQAQYDRIRDHICTPECRESWQTPIRDKNGQQVTTLTTEVLHVAKCLLAAGALAKIDPHTVGVVELCSDPSCAKCYVWAEVLGVSR